VRSEYIVPQSAQGSHNVQRKVFVGVEVGHVQAVSLS
jgi:hypothetical protein